MRYEDSELVEIVDRLDRLHLNTWLDVRHRELFNNHALCLWPRLSAQVRRLLERASALALVLLPGPF